MNQPYLVDKVVVGRKVKFVLTEDMARDYYMEVDRKARMRTPTQTVGLV